MEGAKLKPPATVNSDIQGSMSLPSFGDRRFLFTRTNMYHFLIVKE